MDVMLEEFNAAHYTINFTLENESEDGFALLDVLTQRKASGSVELSVCRKPTYTGQ